MFIRRTNHIFAYLSDKYANMFLNDTKQKSIIKTNVAKKEDKMKFVIQIVSQASVTIDQQLTAEIGRGFLVLIGINNSDTKETADKMIRKMLGLRIFEDAEGKTNLSLSAVSGQLLLVSQFTLYADCRKGNRPSFINAGSPDLANELYEYIIQKCRTENYPVETGVFGADMKINLTNDGPFTIILDSEDL